MIGTASMASGAHPSRIAVLVSRFPELSQTFVLDQVSALREAGFAVHVFARTRSESGVRHPVARELLAHGSYADQHPLVRMLDRSPSRVHEVGRALAYRRLQRTATSRFDLVLCHFGPIGLGTALHAGRVRKAAPIWTIFHGHDVSRFVRERGDGVYRPLFDIGARFLPISRFWRQRLIELGSPPARTEVLRMGVDCEAIRYAPNAGRRGEPVRILTVGRLVEKKGTAFSLRALAEVVRVASHLPWTFEIVGDGPLQLELTKLAGRLGLSDRVHFLGSMPSNEVRDRLVAADLFLLPSVTASDGDMEGIPVALMEAMAAGVPVISSFHSGIPELIEHGVSGLLADERDVAGLARHIRTLIEDTDARTRLVDAARRTVEQDFNQDLIHAHLVDSIHAALRAEEA